MPVLVAQTDSPVYLRIQRDIVQANVPQLLIIRVACFHRSPKSELVVRSPANHIPIERHLRNSVRVYGAIKNLFYVSGVLRVTPSNTAVGFALYETSVADRLRREPQEQKRVSATISPPTYFFSRWEANYARLLNYRGVKWIHQPKTFQLKSQKYTPDFYLPEVDTYIEIKNYLSDYSKNRDRQFREMYPELKLVLILKEDYLGLQKEYAPKIKEWEHNNSPTN